MARSTQEIQNEIIATVQSDPTLSESLHTPSKTGIYRLWAYVVAFCFGTIERLQDALRIEVNDTLSRLKPHTVRWYAEKARAFQYGFNLLPDSDLFDNSNSTEELIEESKIVAYSAVVEQMAPSGRTILRIKVAASNGTDLEPLTAPQLNAVKNYFSRIKDAGVPLIIDSLPPDKIRQTWRIFYDPLILSASGDRLDGQEEKPVENAIKNYLKNLPFNGTYVRAYHIDAVQLIEGVVVPELDKCETTYGNLDFSDVDVEYNPDAGYLRFEQNIDLTIQYIPRSAIQ